MVPLAGDFFLEIVVPFVLAIRKFCLHWQTTCEFIFTLNCGIRIICISRSKDQYAYAFVCQEREINVF